MADLSSAHQTAQRYSDHQCTTACRSRRASSGSPSGAASQQGNLLLQARERAREGQHILLAERSRSESFCQLTKRGLLLTSRKLKLRLKTLLDKERSLKSRSRPASGLSSNYVTLVEGFQLFCNDLDKLQQFVQVNQTAFSKILKKVRYPL